MDKTTRHSALVVAVNDGDGVHLVHGGRQIVCRLWGIDAPEYNQPWGPEAKHFLHSLVSQKHVSVTQHGVDSFGRALVQLQLPINRDVAGRLIEEGLAWVYPPGATKLWTYKRLEDCARALRHGLWCQQDPMPPWIWRRTHAPHRVQNPRKGPSAGRVRPQNLVDVEVVQGVLPDTQ